ncbi:MAG: hypothetical protein WC894_06425 [Patescibacteria group bacterium]
MESFFEAVKTFNFGIAGLIIFLYTITDGLYAKYTLDVANYNEYRAATIGSLMHFFIAFGVINYTHNWLYIFAVAIGSWVGTFLTVRRERKNREGKVK